MDPHPDPQRNHAAVQWVLASFRCPSTLPAEGSRQSARTLGVVKTPEKKHGQAAIWPLRYLRILATWSGI
jgi:hypothetical protein